MTTEVTTQQPRSIVQDMAEQYGMDKRAFEATLKATVIPANVSNEQFAAFLLVAREYKLNPLTKEIWAYPSRTGGVTPVVSVDGWANIINSHPAMDGLEYEDIFNEGQLSAIKCTIYRKDRSRSIGITEYMNECKGTTEPWKRWPARMLRHKATIQCARMAFGFSGIYDEDEAARIVDVTPPEAKPIFKTATARNEWFKRVVESFTAATTIDELNEAVKQQKEKFKELTENGNEHELLAVEELRKRYEQTKTKLTEESESNYLDDAFNRVTQDYETPPGAPLVDGVSVVQEVAAVAPSAPKAPRVITVQKNKEGVIQWDAFSLFLKQEFKAARSQAELDAIWKANDKALEALQVARTDIYEAIVEALLAQQAQLSKS